MYHQLLWRSGAQALGYMHSVRSLSDRVKKIFGCHVLEIVRTYRSRFTFYRDLPCW